MTNAQFTQSANEPRLYWLDGGTWGTAGAFGMVLFGDPASVPASLSLADTWLTHRGFYVTVTIKPDASKETAFADAVLALAERLGGGARFVWLETSDAGVRGWGERVLYVTQADGATDGTINRPSVFALGAYRFTVSGGQTIGQWGDGFSFDSPAPPAFQLVTDAKAWPLAPVSQGAVVLSVDGATAGTFRVDGSLNGGVADLDLLDVGFRYGVPDQSDPNGFHLVSLRYPLFKGTGAAIPISFLCDPAGVLDPARTQLSYRGSSIPAHDTHYTSQLGYGITLTPNGVDTATGLPAGFAFHRRPGSRTALDADDPLYLAPIGAFTMDVGTPPGASASPAARLTGGISGIEYFGFSDAGSVPVSFHPAKPAFAPDFPPQKTDEATGAPVVPEDTPLSHRATTANAVVAPPSGGEAWYYAQPSDGAFFHIRPDGGGPPADALLPYLTFLELVTKDVGASQPDAYPLVPYAGVEDDDLAIVQALEAQILSPLRRAALGVQAHQAPLAAHPEAMLAQTDFEAVTPQGILAQFQSGTMTSLILSKAPVAGQLPQLAFNQPSDTFRGALQSNQLFMVACDGALLLQNIDLNYWITEDVLGDLTRLSGAEAVPADVVTLLQQQGRTPQTSLSAFTAMLQGILTGGNAQYIPTVTKYSVYCQLDVEGWRFRLSPTLWADQQAHPPIMIFKFAAGSLYDFVQNTDAWAWPDVGKLNGSLANTKELLNRIISDAVADVETNGSASMLSNFVTGIVNNPGWMGVLFLNANVPFSSVPPELSGLAAGISPEEFRAHHVGISVTPIDIDAGNRTLSQGDSAVFGLIDYDQPEDIAHIEGDFDFKVLLLQVLFINSAIANFAGRIELFVNRLFSQLVTLYESEHYNNILLEGSYQRQGTSGHYVFATGAANVFGADSVGQGGSDNSSVLTQTEFDQAQFVTATADTATSATTRTRFLLQGKLRFADLPRFDAFSFGPVLDRNGVRVADGYLSFSGVSVDMDFPVSAPDQRTFRFNLDEISFDPASSKARPTSFFQRFPLQVGGLIEGQPGSKPRDLGYLGLETPLSQPGFSGAWYGLVFNVDLGTLGALSSAPALGAGILVAWSPTATGADVNVGLKLPGVESVKSLMPIQGVIDLGFNAIDVTADGATADPPDPAYVLRFRDFYLRFLGWKFPPGQNTIALFGNPDAATQDIATDRGALGWYAAYAKKE